MFNCECSYCKNKIYKKPNQIKKFKHLFCNKECQGKYQRNGSQVPCTKCSKLVYKKRYKIKKENFLFCSKECSSSYFHFIDGSRSYRDKCIKRSGITCYNNDCPLIKNNIPIKKWMIDVDHFDGNRNNNDPLNLRPLCVLCHALISRKKNF